MGAKVQEETRLIFSGGKSHVATSQGLLPTEFLATLRRKTKKRSGKLELTRSSQRFYSGKNTSRSLQTTEPQISIAEQVHEFMSSGLVLDGYRGNNITTTMQGRLSNSWSQPYVVWNTSTPCVIRQLGLHMRWVGTFTDALGPKPSKCCPAFLSLNITDRHKSNWLRVLLSLDLFYDVFRHQPQVARILQTLGHQRSLFACLCAVGDSRCAPRKHLFDYGQDQHKSDTQIQRPPIQDFWTGVSLVTDQSRWSQLPGSRWSKSPDIKLILALDFVHTKDFFSPNTRRHRHTQRKRDTHTSTHTNRHQKINFLSCWGEKSEDYANDEA